MLPGSCHLPDVYSLENKGYNPFVEQPGLTDMSLYLMQEFRVGDLQCVVVLVWVCLVFFPNLSFPMHL